MAILEGEYIQGAKGGKPSEEPSDTLRSRQTVRLLFAISEGVISAETPEIYLNKSSIENFKHDELTVKQGTDWQGVIPGFIAIEASKDVPTQFSEIRKATTDTNPQSKDYKDYSVSLEADVDAVNLTFTLSSLRLADDKGNIKPYTVEFNIATSFDSTFSVVKSENKITKKGKVSTVYAFDVLVKKPPTTQGQENALWYVGVKRLTIDDDTKVTAKQSSKTSITSIISIQYKQLPYPNTALLGLVMKDADEFGGKIPDIIFRVKGIKVRIPTAYNPEEEGERYTGQWDGKLKYITLEGGITHDQYEWTANPAWILFDVLTRPSSRGGLGIADKDIDLPSIYLLGKYCDDLVESGRINTNGTLLKERRYELHNQFATRENVPTFLMYILTICNANITTNEFGQISVMWDREGQEITKQVSNANVVDGIFTYSSNDFEARYTVANVTFNNPDNFGETITTTYIADGSHGGSDFDLVSRYGIQTIDIVLAGCMSEAQAIRKARWAIYSNSITTGFVGFKVGFTGINYKIGELINIYDNYNASDSLAGIVTGFLANTRSFRLDKSITRIPTGSWVASYYTSEGIVSSIVSIEGDVVTLPLKSTLPILSSLCMLSDSTLSPKVYKVIKIDLEEDVYFITCSEHFEGKYSFINSGILLKPPSVDFIDQTYFEVPAPTTLKVTTRTVTNKIVSSYLDLDWKIHPFPSTLPRNQRFKPTYKLIYSLDGVVQNTITNIEVSEYSIKDPIPGVYEFRLWAINPKSGRLSSELSLEFVFRPRTGRSDLKTPTNIKVQGSTATGNRLPFTTKNLTVNFEHGGGEKDTLKDFLIEIRELDNKLVHSYYIPSTNTQFQYNLGTNLFDKYPTSADTVSNVGEVYEVTYPFADDGLYNSYTIGSVISADDLKDMGSLSIVGSFPTLSDVCGFGIDIQPDSASSTFVILCKDFKINCYIQGTLVYSFPTLSTHTPSDSYEIEFGFEDNYFVVFKKSGKYSYRKGFTAANTDFAAKIQPKIIFKSQNSVISDLELFTLEDSLYPSDYYKTKNPSILAKTISFTFPYEDNLAFFKTPARSFRLRFYARDFFNDLSKGVGVRFDNYAPPTDCCSFTVKALAEAVLITITPTASTDEDILGYCVWQENPSLTKAAVAAKTPIYKGESTSVTLAALPDVDYEYWVAAYDSYGKSDLNLLDKIPLTVRVATNLQDALVIVEGLEFSTLAHGYTWTEGVVLNNNNGRKYVVEEGSTTTQGMLSYFVLDFDETLESHFEDSSVQKQSITKLSITTVNIHTLVTAPPLNVTRVTVASWYITPLGGYGLTTWLKESANKIEARTKARIDTALDLVEHDFRVTALTPKIVLKDKNDLSEDGTKSTTYSLTADKHIFTITADLCNSSDNEVISQRGFSAPLRINFDDKSLSIYGNRIVDEGRLANVISSIPTLDSLLTNSYDIGCVVKSMLDGVPVIGTQRMSSSGIITDAYGNEATDGFTLAVRNQFGSCAFHDLIAHGGLKVIGNINNNGSINTYGKVVSQIGMVAPFFNTPSDENLKTIHSKVSNALSGLCKLTPIKYTYNNKYLSLQTQKLSIGLIAQEVEVDFPEVVTSSTLFDGDDTEYKSLDYSKLIPVLIQAIKELNEKVDLLTSKLFLYETQI